MVNKRTVLVLCIIGGLLVLGLLAGGAVLIWVGATFGQTCQDWNLHHNYFNQDCGYCSTSVGCQIACSGDASKLIFALLVPMTLLCDCLAKVQRMRLFYAVMLNISRLFANTCGSKFEYALLYI